MHQFKFRTWFVFVLTIVLFVSLLTPSLPTQAQQEPDRELWKALLPLDTVISFMNTGAHPDDEQSALLAYLSLGKGVRTISVLANRGEGGQNQIGKELGNALGIIRSRELQEAAKLLNVHLFMLSEDLNDPIYDFGFSKSPEETLKKWGETLTYERLIRRIREERPDIVMPSFRDVPTEHGHHRAISELTLRAFRDAADPNVFPEQIRQGLKPWQIKKLYLPGTNGHETLRFNIGGKPDPIYGLTYPQLGEESRKMHKSQGMGRDLPVDDYFISLELVNSATGSKGKESSLFDSLPYDFADYAKQVPQPAMKQTLILLQDQYDRAIQAYPNRAHVTQEVQKALQMTRLAIRLAQVQLLNQEQKEDLLYRLQIKERQLQHASAVASKIQISLGIDREIWTLGSTSHLTLTLRNNSDQPITGIRAKPVLPGDHWKASVQPYITSLGPKRQQTIRLAMSAPVDHASFFHPYHPSIVQIDVSYRLQGQTVTQRITPDTIKQTAALLPDWGFLLSPESSMINTAKEQDTRTIHLQVTNYKNGPSQGTIHVNVPEGWKAEPAEWDVHFAKADEQQSFQVNITTPKGVKEQTYDITFEANVDGHRFNSQVQQIFYPHIGTSYYVRDAKLNLHAFSLKLPTELKIGYVESGFDDVSNQLRQAGLNVTSLTEEDLKNKDLSRYDTIVVGIRAYLSRSDLLANNQRLLDYVKNGGHVVMQYHKPEDNWKPELAPYPLTPGDPPISWRVTDETAPVTFLHPDHPIMQWPNKITSDDFGGWVQERGVYFPSSWDKEHYLPLLSISDPGEEPFASGLLVADYGKGTYIYTSLVWYRQIQAQVPGGYHMFINLVSYPHTR
ncbi:PIG-L domain-containing protein [Polycladomyces abyssicola]|uniref:PIG-L domain-containing protein n=1 Tax=Polycladomyces abyssicola TaxID=1125966 RepID=A0A8D5ZMC9_9BACL|nr:PIG-L family deacetylase [Polycladomyces abyssicola]BCU81525.1 PIG-L domain-containing protein [Polycladomyces abyssicola]